MAESDKSTFNGRLVVGHAKFLDPKKQGVPIVDVMFRDPRHPGCMALLGLQLLLEDKPRFRQVSDNWQTELEGMPFSMAVLMALPRPKLEELLRRCGEELTDEEAEELQAPLFRLALRGECIIAAAPQPPTPDPVYEQFSPLMLAHWTFHLGLDIAVPRHAAALDYIATRAFSREEWRRVEAAGRRLRPRPITETALPYPPGADLLHEDPATAWMQRHVHLPGTWKRDSAIQACREATKASYRDALEAWNALPTHLRGRRGAHK